MKVVGRRKAGRNGIESAAGFLELVVALRGKKPFVPKGVHRFKTFEDSQAWTLKMITRRPNPGRRPIGGSDENFEKVTEALLLSACGIDFNEAKRFIDVVGTPLALEADSSGEGQT